MTSNKKTLDLAKEIRFATRNRKILEPGLEKSLAENSGVLNDFFSVEMVEIILNDGKKEDRPLVYCNDLKNLLNCIKEFRDLKYFHLKVGIDGGRGFLKLTLSIQSLIESRDETKTERNHRRRFKSEELSLSKFKDSSVKKIFILGIVPLHRNYMKT